MQTACVDASAKPYPMILAQLKKEEPFYGSGVFFSSFFSFLLKFLNVSLNSIRTSQSLLCSFIGKLQWHFLECNSWTHFWVIPL